MEYYSAAKRMKFCHLQQHGWSSRALYTKWNKPDREKYDLSYT